MTDRALLEIMDSELTTLEHELSHLFDMSKAKKSDTVEDDWSTAAAPDENLDDDDSDDDDPDDDEDDVDKFAPTATKFEAIVDKIASNRGVPKPQAMVIVRREYPDLFAGYQSSGVIKSYRTLVEDEIGKGCSVDVACQRVAYAHPDLARSGIAKAEGSAAEFMGRVDTEMQKRGCSRTEAMQQVRKVHPDLFRRFQNV